MIEAWKLLRSNATQISRGDEDLAERLKELVDDCWAAHKGVYVRWITTVGTYEGEERLVDKLQYLSVSNEIEAREGPGVFAMLEENDTWEDSRIMTTRAV